MEKVIPSLETLDKNEVKLGNEWFSSWCRQMETLVDSKLVCKAWSGM